MITTPGNLTTPNTKFRKLFGKLTKFLYQNNYELYKSDTAFFSLAPDNLRTYYFNAVKLNLEWYRGFVPGIHQNGIIATKMGMNCCNTVSNMITAGDFRFESENPEWKTYLDDFVLHTNFRDKFKRIQPIKEAIGFALAVIDVKAEDDWSIDFTAGNRYFVETDKSGKVLAFRRLIQLQSSSLDKNDSAYYLVEDRWIRQEDQKCYHRFKLYKGPISCLSAESTLTPYPNPNEKILQLFDSYYQGIHFDEIAPLPFENHCGAVILHASKTAVGVEDYAQFSDSLLAGAHTYLLEYDEIFTSKQQDRVMADKGVLVPRGLTPGDVASRMSPANGTSYEGYSAFKDLVANPSLTENIYESMPTTSPDKQAPFFFQSEYRQDSYNADLDKCRQRIADAIKIDSHDLGSHTEAGEGTGNKTATEVNVLSGISKTTIDDKRALMTDKLEELFRIILSYAFGDSKAKASMIFNSSRSNDPESETRDLTSQISSGILSKKTALKRKNPNYSDEEVEAELEQIRAEKREEAEQQTAMMGSFNDYGNGEEETNVDGQIIEDEESTSIDS